MKTKKVSKRVAQLLALEKTRIAKKMRRAQDTKQPTQAPLINAPDPGPKKKATEPGVTPLIDENDSDKQLKDKKAPAPKTPSPDLGLDGGPEMPAVFEDQEDFMDVDEIPVESSAKPRKASTKKCKGVIAMIKAKAAGGASRRPFGR